MPYRSVPAKPPLPGKHPCTIFQGATVATSIQMYGILIPGKCLCRPKSQVVFERPWALTRDTTVIAKMGWGLGPKGNDRFPNKLEVSRSQNPWRVNSMTSAIQAGNDNTIIISCYSTLIPTFYQLFNVYSTPILFKVQWLTATTTQMCCIELCTAVLTSDQLPSL